jgi:hypothetical protein
LPFVLIGIGATIADNLHNLYDVKGASDERRQVELQQQQHVIDECRSLLMRSSFGSTPGLCVEDCRITSAAGELSSLSPPPITLVVKLTLQSPLFSVHSDG